MAITIPTTTTYSSDQRKPIHDLYASYMQLAKAGWIVDEIGQSTGQWQGQSVSLPILAFRTPRAGDALYILSGMHGEEPAGPMALAESISMLQQLGKKISVVLIPFCNPLGYLRNWRYLNMPTWSPTKTGSSAGDSEHYLPQRTNTKKARSPKPANREAKALTDALRRYFKTYSPILSVDLHEDDNVGKGYIYSQGELGATDPLAQKAVIILAANNVLIKQRGFTNFKEPIIKGIVSAAHDGSIDEFIAAETIIVKGKQTTKPYARTVLVIETPSKTMSLTDRKNAQKAIIKHLSIFVDILRLQA